MKVSELINKLLELSIMFGDVETEVLYHIQGCEGEYDGGAPDRVIFEDNHIKIISEGD